MEKMQLTKKKPYIIVDEEKEQFYVNRAVYTDENILAEERKKIFSKCWLYLGHESEVKKPGNYKTRRVGGRSLIFVKDTTGEIRCFHNTCPHRGALVSREKEGTAKVFQCFYHAWTFNTKGELIGTPGAAQGGYSEKHNCDGSKNLKEVPRLESYRGFVFINFDKNAMSLEDYLAGAKEYLDLVVDQSEVGMEIIGTGQEYSMNANYKLLAENSVDSYHGLPTHKTYFEYVAERGGITSQQGKGKVKDLGNGHAVIQGVAGWGRPVARWIPAWGEEGKKEIEQIYQKLVARVGEERANTIANTDRNMIIFPNLVINDIMAITVRMIEPVTVDKMEVTGWALGPMEESRKYRQRRLNNFLEFLGPAGFATPDDVEALELAQEGMKTNPEVEWNDISKGMAREIPLSSDEVQMRVYWKQWNKIMTEEE